jgi:hypothetical protein
VTRDEIEAKDSLEAGRMKSWICGAAIGAMALVTAGAGIAQETSNNRVNAITDWSVFEGQDPRECWAVTTYKESVNTRGGRVVAVTRGEILLMVFFRPGAEVQGQVAFTGGYPFASGSTVNVNIGGTEFELFTEGEWAWPATPQDDAKIVTAMKRGVDAVLTAQSSRGTTTKDTFSLLGFTAAFEDAEQRCSS